MSNQAELPLQRALCSRFVPPSKLAEQTLGRLLSDREMKDGSICHVHSDITAEQLRERNLIFLAIALALGIPLWLIVEKAEK